MPACPPARAGMRFFAEIGKTGLTNAAMRGIIYLAFAGVAHLVERDLAKVEVASSSLVARSKKNTPSDRMGYSFWNVPRADLSSLPRPARSSGRTAAGFRVGRPVLRLPSFIAGAFVCRAVNRSVGDGVPDVPSARRCRAGNGFPRRFAPRSKCPWGTDWRGNPFLKRIIPALFRRFPAKRLRIPTPVTSVTGSE